MHMFEHIYLSDTDVNYCG